MKKRVFLIVLDSLGAGEAPDAADFGDKGANTLRSLSRCDRLAIPNLRRLGLANIEGLDFSYLSDKDVVRHPLVQKIIAAYERYEKKV